MTETAALLLLVIDGTYYQLDLVPGGFTVRKQGASSAYTVRRLEDRWRCQCAGHAYRGQCRHLRALRQVGLIEARTEKVTP